MSIFGLKLNSSLGAVVRGNSNKTRKSKIKHRDQAHKIVLEALEPRVLLSADLNPMATTALSTLPHLIPSAAPIYEQEQISQPELNLAGFASASHLQDGIQTAFVDSAVTRQAFAGSLVSRTYVTGYGYETPQTDWIDIDIRNDLPLTASVVPADSGSAQLLVRDTSGNIIDSTSGAAGEMAYLSSLRSSGDGLHGLGIEIDQATAYSARLTVGAVTDEAADNSADALSLDSSAILLPNGMSRLAAEGVVSGQDLLSFSATAGERLTIVVSGFLGAVRGELNFSLFDTQGALVASGDKDSVDFDAVLSDYVATQTGVYTVRIEAVRPTEYTAVVVKNGGFDAAPAQGQSQNLSSTGNVLGGFASETPLRVGVLGRDNIDNFLSQLNNTSIWLDIQVFDPSSVVSAADFGDRDLIIIGDPDGSWVSDEIGNALREFVEAGGGLITAGSALSTLWQGSSEFREDINAIVPVDTEGSFRFVSGEGINLATGQSPITVGLAMTDEWTSGVIAAGDAEARTLVTKRGQTYLATGFIGAGRSVFLAPEFFNDSYEDQSLRGINDTLLRRAMQWAGRNSGNDNSDVYNVQVNEGDAVAIDLRVVGTHDGVGGGEVNAQSLGSLDIYVEVRDADGNYVSLSGSQYANISSDGFASFIALSGGRYTVTVFNQGGQGAYALNVDGATGEQAPFAVTNIQDGAFLALPYGPSSISIDVSADLDVQTVDAADLTVNGVAATGFRIVDGTTIEFFTDGLFASDGLYTVSLIDGAFSDVAGRAVTGGSAQVLVDTQGPRIIYASISEGQVFNDGMIVAQFQLDEDVDQSQSNHFAYMFNTVDSSWVYVNWSSYDAETRTVTVGFDAVPDGQYQFHFSDISVSDFAGNALDGDNIGTPSGDGVPGGNFVVNILVDSASVSSLAFSDYGQPSALIYEAVVNSTIASSDDVDDFNVSLLDGQLLNLIVNSTASGAIILLELIDANGDVIASANSAFNGEGTLVHPTLAMRAPDAGNYVVRLTASSPAIYSLTAVVNAAVETSDSDQSDPLSLDESALDAGSNIALMSVVGAMESDYGSDAYSFTLAAGESASIALDAIGLASGLSLRLLASDGSVLAQGLSRGSVGAFIDRFRAPDAGTYTLLVDGQGTTADYSLVVTRNASIEAGGLQAIGQAVIGSSNSGAGSIRVAIHRGESALAQALNTSGAGLIQAVNVSGDQIDTEAELSQYDVVIIGSSGYSNEFDGFATALRQFVEAGGGLVATGWTVYSAGTATGGALDDINAVVPIDTSMYYSYSSGSLVLTSSGHPILDGVNSFYAPYSEYSSVDPEGEVLATVNGQAAVVTGSYGRGNSVYLGPTYVELYSSFPSQDALRLLSQAVAWAAQATTQYVVQVNAGDQLHIEAQPLGEGPDRTGNALSAVISIEGPDGTVYEGNAADPSTLDLLATLSGQYVISISSSAGQGGYLLTVEGATGEQAFGIAAQSVPNGAILTELATMQLTLSAPVLMTSFEPGDVLIDGVPATSVSLDGLTLTIELPAFGDGNYTISIDEGALVSVDGRLFAGFSTGFVIDNAGPSIIDKTVEEGVVLELSAHTFGFTFSEDIDEAALDASDFVLTYIESGASVAPSGFSYDAASRTASVSYEGLVEGMYSITVLGGVTGVRDLVGNEMVNNTTTFSIDSSVQAVVFEVAQPGGSMIYRSQNVGSFFGADDTDSFTVDLSAGKQLSLELFGGPGFAGSISVRNASGTVVAATAPGSNLLAAIVLPAGLYSIDVSGEAAGNYDLVGVLNAVPQPTGGAAQAIDGSAIAVGTAGTRYAAVGITTGAPQTYTLDLVAGNTLSVALSGAGLKLELFNSNGVLIAVGANGETLDQLIAGLPIATTGTHTLRVSGAADVPYSLVAARNIQFDIEDGQAVVPLSGSELLGGLGGAPAVGGDDVAIAAPLFNDLRDGTNFRWDISQNGSIGDGTNDAYDTGMVLVGFGSQATAQSEQSGREIYLGPAQVGDVQVSRKIYVPADQGFARFLETVTNPTGATVTYTVRIQTNLGSDSGTQIIATSDGGAFTASDNWIITDDSSNGGGDPTMLHVLAGLGTVQRPSSASRSGDNLYYDYTLVLRPGETKSVMHFASQNVNQATALLKAPLLADLAPELGVLDGLSALEMSQVVNFDLADLQDRYSVQAAPGATLSIETTTPGSGTTGAPVNALNVRLELYNPFGVLVATSNNDAADGVNGLLTYQIPEGEGGTYEVRVIAEDNNPGAYVLKVQGGTYEAVAPQLQFVSPNSGALPEAPTNITFRFSESIDPLSLQTSDLVISNGGVVTGVELIDGRTVRFQIALPDIDGVYNYSLLTDAITDLQGLFAAAYDGSLLIDTGHPTVTQYTPLTANAPFNNIVFTFSEPIDPASVSVSDIAAFTGPTGANLLGQVTGVSVTGNQVTVSFNNFINRGTYTMTLGTQVLDMAGNALPETFTATVDLRSADLSDVQISVPPDAVFGSPVTITYTVTNSGNAPINTWWYDTAFLTNSGGANLNHLFDNFVDFRAAPLAAGASYTRTVTFTLPLSTSLAAGNWSIALTADNYGYLSEDDRGDNRTISAPFQITLPPLPDLRIENASAPATAFFDETIQLSWDEANRGPATTSSGWNTAIFLSTDTSFQSWADTYLGIFENAAIAADAVRSKIGSVTLPLNSGLVSGVYQILFVTDYYGQVYEHAAENNNVAAVPITITVPTIVDLQVDSVSAPPSGVYGQTIDVTWTVSNHGSAEASANLTDRVYLQSGANRILLHTETIGQVTLAANGGGYSRTVSMTLPLNHTYEPGNLQIVVETDSNQAIFEYRAEDNNTRTSAISTTNPPLPDLQVDSVSLPSATLSFGQDVVVEWTTRNHGDATVASNWRDRIYLSRDAVLDGSDLVLADVAAQAAPLPAGESYSRSQTVRLPLNLDYANGTYYVFVASDQWDGYWTTSTVYEAGSNELNNSRATSATLTIPPLPDLTVSDIVAPANALAGQPMEVTWRITNTGAAAYTGSWTDAVMLSSSVTGGSPTFLQSFLFEGTIAAGQTITRTQTVTMPNVVGNRWLVVLTDYDNDVNELTRETNNTAVDNRVTQVLRSQQANLQVTTVTPPSEAFSAREVEVNWVVTNVGDGATSAPQWYDFVYLSHDEVIDDTDLLLGYTTNPSYLAAGGSYVNSGTFLLPEGITGPYRFLVRTDNYGQVAESNDTDNVGSSAVLSVQLSPPPNLEVTEVDAPIGAASGQSMAISYRVTNTGTGATTGTYWVDRIFISDDDVYDVGDQERLVLGHSGRLSAGESYDVDARILIPTAWTGPTWFFVVTDTGNAVYEHSAEGDNSGTDDVPTLVQLTPPPDLETFVTSLPPPVSSGHSFTFSYTVENFGATATPQYEWTDRAYLSLDAVLDASDINLGDFNHYGVLQSDPEAGPTTYSRNITTRASRDLVGDYYLIVVSDVNNRVFELDKANNRGVSATPVSFLNSAADLEVIAAAAPADGQAGRQIRVDWTVRNDGEARSAVNTWVDSIILSVDDVLGNGDDTVIASIENTTAGLPVGGTYDRSVYVTLPKWAKGEYNLFVVSDVNNVVPEGTQDGNNGSAAMPIDIVGLAPDLRVNTLDIVGSGQPGTAMIANWTVGNAGNTPTAASFWYDAVYLTRTEGAPILLTTLRHANPLAGGASYAASAEFRLPDDLPSGDYRILVVTDYSELVEEGSDSNNSRLSAWFSVVADPTAALRRPDLVIDSIEIGSEAVSGQDVAVSWVVRNAGQRDSRQYRYESVYLSRDQNFDRNSDIFVGSAVHFDVTDAALEAGESQTVTRSLTIPRGLSGPFYVFVVADVGRNVAESDESNNVRMAPELLQVVLPQPVDLAVGTIDIPANAVAGAEASFTYSITNTGSTDAIGTWLDRLYLSTDETWDVGDIALGYVRHYDGLVSGDTYTHTLTTKLPGVTPGAYKLIVRTDIFNVVPETNEANNVAGSLTNVSIDVPAITLGVPVAGILPNAAAAAFYKIEVGAGETLRFKLDGLNTATDQTYELYVRRGAMPTASAFDFSSADAFVVDQDIIVPTSEAGTYYIQVLSRAGSGYMPETTYSLVVETIPFSLSQAQPAAAGNAGSATLRIEGAQFSPDTIFRLMDTEGNVLDADRIIIVDASVAMVTFDLLGTLPGNYALQAVRGSSVVALAGGLNVVEGQGANITSSIIGPSAVRPGRVNTVTFSWGNSGDSDTVAPLIRVISTQPFGSEVGDMRTGMFLVLGSSSDGLPSVLRPGGQETESFLFASGARMTFEPVSAQSGEPIDDWAVIGEALRPQELSQVEWVPFWTRMSARLGDDWGDLTEFFNRLAAEYAEPGEVVRDLRGLMLELYNDNPNYVPSVIASGRLFNSTDGTTPIAGEVIYAYRQTTNGLMQAASAVTAADGSFAFAGLVAGTYVVTVSGASPLVIDQDLDGEADTVLPQFTVGDTLDLSGLAFYATDELTQDEIEQNEAPILVTDPSGLLHVFWMRNGALWHSTYENGGWVDAAAVPGIEGDQFSITTSDNLLDGTVSGIVITWRGLPGENGETDIYYMLGAMGSDAMMWTDAVLLVENATNDETPSVVVDENGRMIFAFRSSGMTGADDPDLYYIVLDPDGNQTTFNSATLSALQEMQGLLDHFGMTQEGTEFKYQFKAGDAGILKKLGMIKGDITGSLDTKINKKSVDVKGKLAGSVTFEVSKNKAAARGVEGKLGGELSYTGKWHAEGCDDPEWVLSSSRLVGKVTGGFTFKFGVEELLPVTPATFPILFTMRLLRDAKLASIDANVSITGGVGVSLRWTDKNQDAPPVTYRMPDAGGFYSDLTITPYLSLKIGDSPWPLLALEAGGSLKLSGALDPNPNLTLSGELFFSYGGYLVNPIFPNVMTKVSVSATLWESDASVLASTDLDSLSDLPGVRVELYELEPSEAGGTATDYSGNGVQAIEPNITGDLSYDGAPVLARAPDGTTYAVWMSIGEDGPILSVSHFDGTVWTPLSQITGSVGIVNQPVVSFDAQGRLMVAWTRLDGEAPDLELGVQEDASALAAMAAYQETGNVYSSVLVDGVWSAATLVADLAGNDSQATFAHVGGRTAILWVNSSSGAFNDRVYASFWDGSTWGAPESIGFGEAISDLSTATFAQGIMAMWKEDVLPSELTQNALFSSTYDGTNWSAEIAFAPALLIERLSPGALAQLAARIDAANTPLNPESAAANAYFGPPEKDPDCDDPPEPYEPPVVVPRDPNDILGPVGFGEENWINTAKPLAYTIRFENVASAAAPAQQVVITQQLDADLDFRTFRVDDFGFGSTRIELKANAAFYSGQLELESGLILDVQVFPDLTTGIITWTLRTIDPVTGQPPEDALAGFLPPNDENGSGEGFVSYTIQAKRTVVTGTRIDATATIVFDTEEQIDTPAIFNTLDVGLPISAVEALPATSDEEAFEVFWGGTDDADGSALASYSIYVSTDGGAYALWLEDVTDTSAFFEGEAGHTYAFYSIAKDNAGNVEAAPTVADATIVVAGSPTGSIGGVLFTDDDADGVRDTGETVLSGATVFLDANSDGVLDAGELSVVTGADGSYSFIDLAPGSYSVAIVLDDTTIATGDGSVRPVVVASGSSSIRDFGVFELGVISGLLFSDLNNNGTRQDGESVLAGWTVYLDANNNSALDDGESFIVTGEDGAYSFTGLTARLYTVRQVVPLHWAVSAPSTGRHDVTINSSGQVAERDFANVQLVSISGVKFEDIDGDGVKDVGEQGLSGWTIFLDANTNGLLDSGERSAITGADGAYSFTDLMPGSYLLSEVLMPGWVQTYPGSGVAPDVATSGSTVVLESPAMVSESLVTSGEADSYWANLLTGLNQYRADARFGGFNGAGQSVVVIDTGIDVNHPFFGPDANRDGVADRITFQYDFADRDFDASDRSGHGSNVSSIIAGDDLLYPGVANGADIIALKVFSDNGSGYFAYVEQALQWVIANVTSRNISVINLSIGDGSNWATAASRYGLGDELAALSQMGVIVVAASGNSYYTFNGKAGVAYPAADPSVLAVGAVWSADYGGPWRFSTGSIDYATGADHITSFTQRDPNLLDILAPGARLTGANANGGIGTMQGTSQAAAYMAGVAALAQDIAQQHLGRRLGAAEFATLVKATGVTVIDGDNESDNVANSGRAYSRVDIVRLAEAILTLAPSQPGGPDSGPDQPGSGQPSILLGHSVTVGAGETLENVDFGNFRLATYSGTVFEDRDGSGTQDGSETGLTGRTVFLDRNDNGQLDDGEESTVTDAAGTFSFIDLGPGTFTVRQVSPVGWEATTSIAPVTLTSGLAGVTVLGSRNQAPTAANDAFEVIAGGTLTIAAPGLLGNDTDPSDDTLTVTGIVVDPQNGTATVTAEGGLTYVAEAGFVGTDTLVYQIVDSHGNVAQATVSIVVAPLGNLPPVAAQDSFNGRHGQPIVVSAANGVLANDSDPEAATLVAVLVDQPAHGTVVLAMDGSFTYTPNVGYVGVDTFTYRATDGVLDSGITTVTLTLTNVAPTAPSEKSFLVAADGVLRGTGLLAGSADADGDSLVTLLATGPAHGTLEFKADGTFTYRPAAGYAGSDSFTYTVSDNVTSSSPVTVTIGVQPGLPAAPLATADTKASASEDYFRDINVLANDKGTGLQIQGFDALSLRGARISLNSDGTLRYDARPSTELDALEAGQTTTDTFAYTVVDAYGRTATARVSVRVEGAVDIKAVDDTKASSSEDYFRDIDVLANDKGEGKRILSFDAFSQHGAKITLNADGTLRFDARVSSELGALNAGETLSDTFNYVITDAMGRTSQATVSVRVEGKSELLAVADKKASSSEDYFRDINVLANDKGEDVRILNFDGFSQNGAKISLNADGSLRFDARASASLQLLQKGQTLNDTFRYTITDESGATSTATVTVRVEGASEVIAKSINSSISEDWYRELSVIDPNAANDVRILTFDSVSAHGAAVSLQADGKLRYDPRKAETLQALRLGQSMVDTFTYTLTNDAGEISQGTIKVTVTGVDERAGARDDFAVTAADSAIEIAVMANDRNVDGVPTTVKIKNPTTKSGATLTILPDNTFRFDPTTSAELAALQIGQTKVERVDYQLVDAKGVASNASIYITVEGTAMVPQSDPASVQPFVVDLSAGYVGFQLLDQAPGSNWQQDFVATGGEPNSPNQSISIVL